jgi:hypothetical protein
VYVVDDTGTESRGRVDALTSTQLTLDVDGVIRRLDEARVRQVQRYGDSVWNGTLIGVGAALPGMLLGDSQYRPCTNDRTRQCAQNDMPYRLAAVGIFGAIGAGIDALMRARHQVFLAPTKSATEGWSVHPVLGPDAAGVTLRRGF